MTKREKVRSNVYKLSSCKSHYFDIPAAIERERTKQEKFGVILGNISAKNYVMCRCKNCGGKVVLWYAAPYMDGKRAAEREAVIKDRDGKGYINFAVDFDGVLCKSAYPTIGEPNINLIRYLIEEQKKGNKIILWTARTDTELQKAVDWCREQGLEFNHVNEGDPVVEKMYGKPGCPTRKIYADVYIDDRNMAPSSIW